MFSLLPATCPALLKELVLVLNSTFMGYLLLHCFRIPPKTKIPTVRIIYVRTYATTIHNWCDTEESCRYVASQLNDLLQDYSSLRSWRNCICARSFGGEAAIVLAAKPPFSRQSREKRAPKAREDERSPRGFFSSTKPKLCARERSRRPRRPGLLSPTERFCKLTWYTRPNFDPSCLSREFKLVRLNWVE